MPDLERIGDEAQRIAKMALEMSSMAHPQDPLTELREMIRLCREHLRAALDAFARVDADDAADIIGRDKHVDALYNIQIARLVALMEQEPTQVRPLLNIVWCARALERIGDHAKNVCEYVVYLSGGRDVRHRARSELGGGDVS